MRSWTVKSSCFPAITCLRFTTLWKFLSAATSRVSFDERSRSETRVQSVIAFEVGKPDDTPWANLPAFAIGVAALRATAA